MNYRFFLIAGLLLSVLSGCVKEPLRNLNEEERRIYLTNRDSSVDFGSYTTYSIVDSVSVIDNGRIAGKQTTNWDLAVIDALVEQMNARGFQRVGRSENPDLGINVARIYNTYTGMMTYNDYWGGYGGYYDPYYWGYPGSSYYFPTYYGIYEVTEGAVSIDILDLKNTNQDNRIEGIWNGLIRGEGTFRTENASSIIASLFAQSPYLTTN